MRYLIANLSLMILVWVMLTSLVALCFTPPSWVYFLVVPTFFFVAGYLEERALSKYVNWMVDKIWRVGK